VFIDWSKYKLRRNSKYDFYSSSEKFSNFGNLISAKGPNLIVRKYKKENRAP